MAKQRAVAGFLGQPARDVLDDAVARIGDRVDGMAEADDDLLAREARADVGDGFLGRAIALLDLERDLVRAAVLRAAQRADAAGDAGVQIRARAGDDARRERRGVELVLGVQHERRVHRADPRSRRRPPMQQRQEMRADRVRVVLDVDAHAGAREVVPVEQHAAERGDEPVGDVARMRRATDRARARRNRARRRRVRMTSIGCAVVGQRFENFANSVR